MANLQKISFDHLLRINEGLTHLFKSGISNGLTDSTEEESYNLFLILQHQEDIQEEIRKRILEVIPQCHLETAPQPID